MPPFHSLLANNISSLPWLPLLFIHKSALHTPEMPQRAREWLRIGTSIHQSELGDAGRGLAIKEKLRFGESQQGCSADTTEILAVSFILMKATGMKI
jgi:hypothetical protein